MDLDYEETCDNLIRWIGSLDLSSPVSEETVTSGYSIAEALVMMDRTHFTPEWLDGLIEVSESDPYQIKAQNLRQVYKLMTSYCEDVLNLPIMPEEKPKFTAIAQSADKHELCLLLSTLVNLAVNCPLRETFIQNMMTLDETVQRSVMRAIKPVEPIDVGHTNNNHASSSNSELSHSSAGSQDELLRLRAECEDLNKRCFALDSQIATLQDEKQMLSLENARLLSKVGTSSDAEHSLPNGSVKDKGSLSASENGGTSIADTNASRRLNDLQSKLDRCQNDLYKAETANEDLHQKLESGMREREELQRRNDELQCVADDYRTLKDECDELRSKLVDVRKLEATIDTYKRKIEEQTDLKAQLKILTDKNDNYMRSVIELEEEQRKTANLKTQLEAYKKQVTEMDAKHTAEVRRADKASFEREQALKKLETANDERARLVSERDYYKDYSDELKASKEEIILSHSSSFGDTSLANLTSPRGDTGIAVAAGGAADMRDRLMRLETENEMLRASTSQIAQVDMLRDQLDVANERKQELETELRLTTQRLDELNARLMDVESEREQSVSGGDARLSDMHKQLEQKSIQLEKLKHSHTEADRAVAAKEEQVLEIKQQLEAKEADFKALEVKFTKFMEKARTVISNQDKSNQVYGSGGGEMSRVEFDSLRRDLELKDKQYQQLLDDVERHRIMHEQEIRLLTTGVHGMGLHLHRQASRERLAAHQQSLLNGGQPSSTFIERQRMLTSSRRANSAQQQGITTQSNSLTAASAIHSVLLVFALMLVMVCISCLLPSTVVQHLIAQDMPTATYNTVIHDPWARRILHEFPAPV